jgi:YVTN family beta-propeller protein
MVRRRYAAAALRLLVAVLVSAAGAAAGDPIVTPASRERELESYTLFESGHVRPLAISADGGRLFAVNTPDGRLEVFEIQGDALVHRHSVPVGLEPVAVVARQGPGGEEVWVVNHLSDSVSVIDASGAAPHVARTLLVGDEPRDVVFAGEGGRRAFVTTAHRGQSSPVDPALTTPSVGRADVWVFDADDPGDALGGAPLTVVTLFGDTPRALAASPDGRTVYAAVFLSGNQTTTLGVSDEAGTYGAVDPARRLRKAEPNANFEGVPAPETGLIVKWNGRDWVDEAGAAFSDKVPFSLPDLDVFEIDAAATPPRLVRSYSGAGTTLFNLAVHPTNGSVYVSNFEARNHVRFAGPGSFSTTVRGHVVEDRITVIRDGAVFPRFLNRHVDFSLPQGASLPSGEKEKSLHHVLGMAVSPDGETLYAAAFGSGKVGVFRTAALEADTFVPDASDRIALPGGGPTGLVLNRDGSRLYVVTRFDNSVHAVDTAARRVIASAAMPTPEPAHIVRGRPFHYDAAFSSANGTAACGTCHLFGDNDALAWDLGNPDDPVVPNPNPFRPSSERENAVFHPMKGPMTTQTLRGIASNGPMHWRGDRTGRTAAALPGESIETSAFKEFREAFVSLLGREREPDEDTLDAYTRFVLDLTHPPNPIRALDNSLSAEQEAGSRLFLEDPQVGFCFDCHTTSPNDGHFGTSGLSSFEFPVISQEFKVPSLRNLYQKVGAFGGGDLDPTGDQVRGFGVMHDGSRGTPLEFLDTATGRFGTAEQRRLMVEFLSVFPTDLAPIVGQQVSLSTGSGADAHDRIDLFLARASLSGGAAECDLAVKGTIGGEQRGWVYVGDGRFQSDRCAEPPVADAELRALAADAGVVLTYTCVPPGSGVRIGVDRDEDGHLDRDELDAGTDPADPADPPRPRTQFRRADCNADGAADISDAIAVLSYLFLGRSSPTCLEACDANADERLELTDAIYLLRHLFLSGPTIPPPFPDCGAVDPPSALGCEGHAACRRG